jgi:exopolysaccharide biosynthesis protein
VAAASDSVEGTFPRFSRNRHPRSAIAVTRDSATLLLVAVDGRRQTSVGMSLVELGDALLSLGAAEALNLDGGGSTALVVGDSLVNVPSDSAGERPVGNVVVVTRGERETRRRAGRVESCVLGR